MREELTYSNSSRVLTENISTRQGPHQKIRVKGKEQKHCSCFPVGPVAHCTACRQTSCEAFSRPGDVAAVVKEGPDAFSFSPESLLKDAGWCAPPRELNPVFLLGQQRCCMLLRVMQPLLTAGNRHNLHHHPSLPSHNLTTPPEKLLSMEPKGCCEVNSTTYSDFLCYWQIQLHGQKWGVERTTRTKAQEVAGRAAGGKGWVEQREAVPQHSEVPVLTIYPAAVCSPPPALEDSKV